MALLNKLRESLVERSVIKTNRCWKVVKWGYRGVWCTGKGVLKRKKSKNWWEEKEKGEDSSDTTIKFVLWRIYEIDPIFSFFFFFCTIRCSIVRKLLENHLPEWHFFILLDIKLNSKKEKKIENSNFHILFWVYFFNHVSYLNDNFDIHFYE